VAVGIGSVLGLWLVAALVMVVMAAVTLGEAIR
jgi:hypothetical protein